MRPAAMLPGMASSSRSSLWADVVLNLAILTFLTIALNAVVLWKVGQGREAALRADLAAELARAYAVRLGGVADSLGAPAPARPRPWADALSAVDVPSGSRPFVVLATSSMIPVATYGTAPPGVPKGPREAELATWMLEAVDLREALASKSVVRSEWRSRESLLIGSVHATASAPVVDLNGRVVAVVRVAMPVGIPLVGPLDRLTLPVLGLTALLSAVGMGAFGYVLFRRRILRPIEALEKGTRKLAEGQFGVRLEEGASNELGAVARQFDELAAALESYRSQNEEQLADLRRINEDLTRTRKELVFAEKMATVGRLASGVAHEVGNPLAAIIGFVDLLQDDDDRSLSADLLPRIRQELDRINHIISELLSYARPTGGTVHDLKRFPIADPLQAARRLIEVQRRFADVRFDEQIEDDLPLAFGHEQRLQQVLLNLFVNAAEAMDRGGRIRTRAFRVEDQPDVVQIEVQDEGPGIPPPVALHVFEPFYTTREVGKGTGLGLSVSLRLMEGMGGTLSFREPDHAPADSMMAGGATFVVTLPVAVEADP